MKKDRCKERVWRNHTWKPSRCARFAVKDGYCKQHHPDSVKLRREKAQAAFDAKLKLSRAPYDRLMELQNRLDKAKMFAESLWADENEKFIPAWIEATK